MSLFKTVFSDVVILCGFASFVYGVSMISEPAAFIVGGALVLYAFARPNKTTEQGEP